MLDDDTVLDDGAGLDRHEDSIEEQQARDARRRESGESQRYAGKHGDLHHLWGWGTRIGWMQEDHAHLYAQAGWCYLPTPEASNALMRFSVKYPIIVKEIQNWQAKAEAAFDFWLETRTRAAEGEASESIGLLGDRVLANTDIIAAMEGVTPNPPKTPSKIRSRDRSVESDELEALLKAAPSREPPATPAKLKRRRTPRGGSGPKIISALCELHQFQEDICLNSDPVSHADIATKADVSTGSLTNFWQEKFSDGNTPGEYECYVRACHNGNLAFTLKLWRGEVSVPHIRRLLREGGRDEND
jgi:hypothetical protein